MSANDATQEIADQLVQGLRPCDALIEQKSAGIYLLALREKVKLPQIDVEADGVIYIGLTSKSLHARNHFRHKDSGRSTLRRSLGALLLRQLALVPIPRNRGRQDRDAINYRFDTAGEARLAEWMEKSLLVSQIEIFTELVSLETNLIKIFQPPLNVRKCGNQQIQIVEAARTVCRETARAKLSKG